MKTNDIANYLLESSPIPQNSNTIIPGTSQLRNDYYTKVWPHGMTSDVTELSPKELQDLIVFQSESIEPRFLYLYIKQTEDNLALLEKEGQKNRVQDLKIRLAICYASLINADRLGKFVRVAA
jgi:hypothetical protein